MKNWVRIQFLLLVIFGAIALAFSIQKYSDIGTNPRTELDAEKSDGDEIDKLWCKGDIFQAQDEAKTHIQQDISLAQPNSLERAAGNARRLSLLYLDFGWPKDAVDASKEALDLDKSVGKSKFSEGQDKNNLAVASYFLSCTADKTAARNNLNDALQMAKEAGEVYAQKDSYSKVHLATVLHNQSLIERDLGNNADAKQHGEEATRLFAELRSNAESSKTLRQ
jgi:hypothetical protein